MKEESSRMRSVASLRQHRNKWGYRGVIFDPRKRYFIAETGSHRNGDRHRVRGFATAEEAAKAYDEMARDRYGERAHLNFPNDGEMYALPFVIKPGLCSHGHDLALYGYTAPSGTVNCRQCNAWAAHRYKQRQRQAL